MAARMPEVSIAIGTTVSHYRILEKLGSGSMGIVYKARDTRLDRFVALKFLPQDSSRSGTAEERFRREARAASALNHPNICTIYEIGEDGALSYIAMEYLEGENLASHIGPKPLPFDRILVWGMEIAAGLEAAHARGIVHRDIKPANLLVTKERTIKILDFGLAKFSGAAGEGPTLASDATAAASKDALTRPGIVLGTVAYMSPEQALGEELDSRSDLFSLGTVLYQMATGRPPFLGDTTAAVLDAILHHAPPPVNKVNPTLPPGLGPIIAKALEKDREVRYQSAAEMRADLKRLRRDSEAVRQTGREPRRSTSVVWLPAGLLVAAAVASAVYLSRRTNAPPPLASREWTQLTSYADSAVAPAISPDGRMLAFIRGPNTFFGPGEIYVKMLPDGQPTQLTHDGMMKMSPQFSPDGSVIAYTAFGRWDTWTVPTLGGEAREMLPNASGLTWIDRQHVLFSEIKKGVHMGVVTATESRTESRDVYIPPRERGMAHRSAISPDHKWVLLAEMDNEGWLPCRLVPFDGSSPGRTVGPEGSNCTHVAWSPDGTQMYLNSDAGGVFHVWKQALRDGKPERVTSGATEEEGIAVTLDGNSVITSVGQAQSTIWFHDAKGVRQISSEGYASDPAFSRDGTKLYYLVSRHDSGVSVPKAELRSTDLASGRTDRLLRGFDVAEYAVSPDGNHVVFSSLDKQGRSHVWFAPADLRSPPREIPSRLSIDEPQFDEAGRIYVRGAEGSTNFVYRVSEDGTGLERVSSEPILDFHSVSPDGRWIVAGIPFEQPTPGPTAMREVATGKVIPICSGYCPARWVWGGRYFEVQFSFMGEPATLLFPVGPGRSLPVFPSDGIRSREQALKIAGARSFDGRATFGEGPSFYAETRRTVHRDLYQIPLK